MQILVVIKMVLTGIYTHNKAAADYKNKYDGYVYQFKI